MDKELSIQFSIHGMNSSHQCHEGTLRVIGGLTGMKVTALILRSQLPLNQKDL